jgi:hypothetical protein
MDGDQFREAVSDSRRRLAVHQRMDQEAVEASRAVGSIVAGMIAGLGAMADSMQRADLGFSKFAEALSEDSWMRQEDAARWTPDSEGNDQDG